MSVDLYYTAPTQEIFNDIKENAIKIWKTYDDQFGYASEKINSIKDIENVKDNYMYMVAMFDSSNQVSLLSMVKPATATLIKEAMS
jgi:hypothetical protein